MGAKEEKLGTFSTEFLNTIHSCFDVSVLDIVLMPDTALYELIGRKLWEYSKEHPDKWQEIVKILQQ